MPEHADSSKGSIARVLDAPHLARLVPHLPPEALHALIQHAGLEACGELVAAATPAQLMSVADLDLWQSPQPGRDEQFDADRFGAWLEVLVDTAPSVAARVVAGMDEHLVITGLARYIRVFDPSAIAMATWVDDDELGEAEGTPAAETVECRVGGYLVRATRSDAWDAIVALLVALQVDYPDRFHALMRGCRRLSNSAPEVDGLDELLSEPEQLLHDVAVDREHRRSRQGYCSPADARAFLALARQHTREPRDNTPSTNPIAAAYFRADDIEAASDRQPLHASESASTNEASAAALAAITGVLAEAGVVPQQPRALLEAPRPEHSRLTRIREWMEYVSDTDASAHFARSRELAFLANTLVAGCSLQSRPFTAQEASDAAVAICNLGLEHWPSRWAVAGTSDASAAGRGGSLPDAFLVDHDLVTAFEVGWAVLDEDVSLYVAEHLIVTLKDLRCADPEIQRGLNALRRELVQQRAAGTPWRARAALDVLAMLDMPAWASLVGLLDECPVLPEALTATLERRTGAVSATAFEFISTAAQIAAVRTFMGRLVDVLGR